MAAWWNILLGGIGPDAADASSGISPQASMAGSMVSINSPEELEAAILKGSESSSGVGVTPEKALRVAAVMGCVRLRAGSVATIPIGIKERVDDRTREDRSDHPVWILLNRRPNKWQKPNQFKRMMEAHVLLRGNAYAAITRGVGGKPIALTPLHPDRVEIVQKDDLSLEYIWTRKDGGKIKFPQSEIFHLMGLTLDGIRGVTPMTYMRDAIGLSLSQEAHGSSVFKNGANVSAAFKLPTGKTLTKEKVESLRSQIDDFRQGGARDGKAIVLEDGMGYERMALTSEDAQWLDARKFSRGDIAMFFGVPPHMIGVTDGNTQLGSSIDSQSQGYVTYTLEDSLTAWEEGIGADLIDWAKNPKIYARFNRAALVRGDIKTRWESYVKGIQRGVYSPNEIREMEDKNPRDGGDIYYDPPNTAGGQSGDSKNVDP